MKRKKEGGKSEFKLNIKISEGQQFCSYIKEVPMVKQKLVIHTHRFHMRYLNIVYNSIVTSASIMYSFTLDHVCLCISVPALAHRHSDKIETMKRRLAWHMHKDDTYKSRNGSFHAQPHNKLLHTYLYN